MKCYNLRKKERSSAIGIPPFFPATIVSETHSVKAVTVLCSSRACFGTYPRMTATLGAERCSVPATVVLHKCWDWFVLVGEWHVLFNIHKASQNLKSLAQSIYRLRSFRLTNKHTCKVLFSSTAILLQASGTLCCANSCPRKTLQSILSISFLLMTYSYLDSDKDGFEISFYRKFHMPKGYTHHG